MLNEGDIKVNEQPMRALPAHGGALDKISDHYRRPKHQWLDLSTGVAPYSYPVGELPQTIWQQLPQPDHELLEVARQYYRGHSVLATSGSQQLIENLPALYAESATPPTRVWLPTVGYKGHLHSWRRAGLQIAFYSGLDELKEMGSEDGVVIINPNNPTARLYSQVEILAVYELTQQHRGFLIVDEAFMDVVSPSQSVAEHTHLPGLLVLKSVGKFFGLAGMRLGFVFAEPQWLKKCQQGMHWQVNGPAQYVGKQALADTAWQQQQLFKLTQQSQALQKLLRTAGFSQQASLPLFTTVYHPQAPAIFHRFAQQGIYLRLCDEKDSLRFGTPDEKGLERLKLITAENRRQSSSVD